MKRSVFGEETYYALNVFSKDLGMGSRASNRPAKSDFFDTKPSIWELINLKLCIAWKGQGS